MGFGNYVWAGSKDTNDFDEYFNADIPARENFPILYSTFLSFRGSGYCDGAANWLTSVYDAFNLETAALHMAIDGLASHVVTLVKIKEKENYLWIVQDATYNLTYVDSKGYPLDIYEITELILQHRESEVIEQFGATQLCYTIFAEKPNITSTENIAEILPGTKDYYPFSAIPIVEKESRYGVLRDMRHPGSFQKQIQSVLNDTLLPLGYPAIGKELFLFPYGIYAPKSDANKQIIIKLKEMTSEVNSNIER